MGIRRIELGEEWWLPPEAAETPHARVEAPAVELHPEASRLLVVGPAMPLFAARPRRSHMGVDRWQ